jgi:hypothetical protein
VISVALQLRRSLLVGVFWTAATLEAGHDRKGQDVTAAAAVALTVATIDLLLMPRSTSWPSRPSPSGSGRNSKHADSDPVLAEARAVLRELEAGDDQ